MSLSACEKKGLDLGVVFWFGGFFSTFPGSTCSKISLISYFAPKSLYFNPKSMGSQILSWLGSYHSVITKKLSRKQMALFIWMYQLCILREYQSEKHKKFHKAPDWGLNAVVKRRDLMPAVAAELVCTLRGFNGADEIQPGS